MSMHVFNGKNAVLLEEKLEVGEVYGFSGSPTGWALILEKQAKYDADGVLIQLVVEWAP